MTSKLGYPYSYGDNDSQIELLNLAKIKKIAFVALFVPLIISQPAHASVDVLRLASGELIKRTSAEALRSASCAAAGACVMGMTQATKCGDITTATAFACGFVVCQCMDLTAKLASATTI